MSKLRKLSGPSELVEDAAQSDKQIDTGGGRDWRCLRTQTEHPAENVGFTAQLVEAQHLRMISAEIAQEIANSTKIVTSRFVAVCPGEGIDRQVGEKKLGVMQPTAWRWVHAEACWRGR